MDASIIITEVSTRNAETFLIRKKGRERSGTNRVNKDKLT